MREQLPGVPVEQCKAKHPRYDIQQIGVLQSILPLTNQEQILPYFTLSITPPNA